MQRTLSYWVNLTCTTIVNYVVEFMIEQSVWECDSLLLHPFYSMLSVWCNDTMFHEATDVVGSVSPEYCKVIQRCLYDSTCAAVEMHGANCNVRTDIIAVRAKRQGTRLPFWKRQLQHFIPIWKLLQNSIPAVTQWRIWNANSHYMDVVKQPCTYLNHALK